MPDGNIETSLQILLTKNKNLNIDSISKAFSENDIPFEVSECTSIDDALEILNNDKLSFDAVISDIQLLYNTNSVDFEKTIENNKLDLEEMNIKLRKELNDGKHVEEKLSDSKGKLYDIFESANLDVTDQIRTYEELLKEKNFTKSVINSLPGVFYVLDRNMKFLNWNQNLEKITGYTTEELSKMDPIELFGTEDKAIITEKIKDAFKSGNSHAEVNLLSKNGRKIPLYFTGQKVEIDDKVCLIGTGIDVTEKRVAETERLRAITERAAIIDSMGDGLILLDFDGKIRDVNPAFERLTGYREHDIIGLSVVDLLPTLLKSKDLETTKQSLKSAMSGYFLEDQMRSVPIKCKTGEDIQVILTTSFLRDEMNNPTAVIINLKDVTTLKEAEEKLQKNMRKLEESNKELEQFAYIASHDLQEPLRKIRSFTELLEESSQEYLDQRTRKYMYYIMKGTSRMQNLINDLLTYSRITTRGRPFELTNCKEVINDVLADLDVVIKESGATVKCDHLPTIKADSAQLLQVFQNLISNAIKFNRKSQPIIKIDAMEHEEDWLFYVRDNGIGISPQYFDRIFTIFQRLHTRNEYPGTGIGLAVCKKIIDRHGGRIWVESEEDKGSTFYFTIPKHIMNLESPERHGTKKRNFQIPKLLNGGL